MKILIETNDDTFEGLIESLQLIADSELNPKALEEYKHWLKHIHVFESAGPMDLTHLRFNNIET